MNFTNSDQAKYFSSIAAYIFTFLLYFFLATVVTWPLINNVGETIIGAEGSENLVHLNLYEWFVDSLQQGAYPKIDTIHGFPNNFYIYFFDPGNGWVYFILRYFFSAIVSYNITLLFNLALVAFSAFMLARYLTGKNLPAIAAGVVFAFNPYMLSQILASGAGELLHVGWPCLWILFLIKTLREKRISNPLLLGITYFMTVYTFMQYSVFLVLFLFFMFLFYILFLRKTDSDLSLNPNNTAVASLPKYSKDLLIRLIVGGALCVILSAYPAYSVSKMFFEQEDVFPTRLEENKKGIFEEYTPGDNHRYTAAISDYFLPGKDRLVKVLEVTRFFRTPYMGWLVIITAMFAVFFIRRRFVFFWAAWFVFIALLASGPFLIISDNIALPGPWSPIFLVTYYLIPIFKMIHEPIWFLPMAMLALGILSAVTLEKVSRGRSLLTKYLIVVGFTFLVLAEYLLVSPAPFPIPTDTPKVPQVYKDIAKDDSSGAVLDLPFKEFGTDLLPRKHFYFQLTHKKPIADSWTGGELPYLTQNSLTGYLMEMEKPENRPYTRKPSIDELQKSLDQLAKDGFKYIVLETGIYDPVARNTALSVLEPLIENRTQYPDGYILFKIVDD